MSNLKGIVHQKNREIMTGRIAIGALLVICLVLCAIIFTAPSRLMIYKINRLCLCLSNLPAVKPLDGEWRGRIQIKY